MQDSYNFETAVGRVEFFADLMDNAVELPIVGGVGIDALVGLLPGAGDAITSVAGLYSVFEGARTGVPPKMLCVMVAGLLLDAVIGSVPVIGDLIDSQFRCHQWNAAIVRKYNDERETPDPFF